MELREVLPRRRTVRHCTDQPLAPQDAVRVEERRRRKEDVVHRGPW